MGCGLRLFTSYSQSVNRKSSAVTATTKGNRATWWLWGGELYREWIEYRMK
nr:MAG TPA: hypothetical protein [Caudoviricetes sp.]